MSEEWDGKGLPPVGVKCEFQPNEWSEWKVVKVLFVGPEFAVFESGGGESVWSLRGIKVRPLPPQTKKIDMAKFAGSDVWLVHINNGEKRNQAKEFDKYQGIMRDVYRPMLDVWNHWTGDSKPEWLEGFEYELDVVNCRVNQRFSVKDEWLDLQNHLSVCAIKITGIKEGWEL